MSNQVSNDTERMLRKWSQNIKKHQKKRVRHYLKNIRFRMNRRRRWMFYGFVAGVFVYLAGVWQLRERIFSIRETEVIEYEIPERGIRPGGESGNSSGEKQTRIRFYLKTGELEILHERKEPGGTVHKLPILEAEELSDNYPKEIPSEH